MLLNASTSVGGASTMGGGGVSSPPPPAPSSSSPIGSGVIVQVGPGSSSSTSSTISTPTSLLTSPVTTPPTPAPSTTSIPLGSLFGVNPLTFPAFSSNVTLTSNHARAGSQDAAFVPNSSSTNITLPVCSPAGGLAPLAILSSPSLGSTTSNSAFSSPTSPTSGGIVSIDVANPSCVTSSATKTTAGASSSLLLPSSSSLLPSCVISNLSTSNNTNNNFTTSPSSSTFPVIHSCHMNSNAISTSTCSLNQSIAAGGIIGVSHGTGNVVTTIGNVGGISEPPPPGPPQHCLLVSCNPTSPSVSSAVNNSSNNQNNNTSTNLISSDAQTDNNNEGSSTIAIAPPPPSRSREHRKRERRERRRDRSYRGSSHKNSSSGGGCSNTGYSGGGQGHSSYHNHHHHHHGNGSSSSGTTSRHHHHHHRVKNSGVVSSSSFNSGNANSSSGLQQSSNNSSSYSNPSSSASNIIGSSSNSNNNNNNTSCATTSTADDLISGIQSTGDDQLSVVSHLPPPSENGTLILGPPPSSPLGIAGMPDLLDSHLPPAPPPYSTLPHSLPHSLPHTHPHAHVHSHVHPPPHPPPQHITMGNNPVPIPLLSSPVPVSLMPAPPPTLISPPTCIPAQPVRYHFSAATRQSRRSMRAHRGVPYASEEEPKTCCGMSASQAVSIRWFIIVIAVIGICCTLAGTALGAARSAGKEHLTLSLLMIGVGVLLLTVSAVAWRLTANESGTSCRAMLGFARTGSSRGDGGAEPNRRFVPRLPPTYGRPHHPYAAMMYPEFQYRPPPPSYQASMQEYRLRLLLLERSNPTIAALGSSLGHGPVTMVPPPPYRPYSANMRMLPHARVDEYSRPPSYRSRSSGNHNGEYDAAGSRPSLDPSVGHNHSHHHHIIESPMHSRDPSLLSYLSQQSVDNMSVVSGHVANLQTAGNPATTTATVVTVVQAVSVGMDIGLGSTLSPYDDDGKGLPSLEDDKGYDPERDNKDGNLVRIVQTTDSSQVIGRDSVIVTVSGGGSNTSLWDTYHHHLNHHQTATTAGYVAQVHTTGTPNNNNIVSCSNGGIGSNSNVITMSDRSSSVGDQGEVQILAHL